MITRMGFDMPLFELSIDTIMSWLGRHFKPSTITKECLSGVHLSIDSRAQLGLFKKVLKTQCPSLWFKQNDTRWLMKLVLTKAIAQDLSTCARCLSTASRPNRDANNCLLYKVRLKSGRINPHNSFTGLIDGVIGL